MAERRPDPGVGPGRPGRRRSGQLVGRVRDRRARRRRPGGSRSPPGPGRASPCDGDGQATAAVRVRPDPVHPGVDLDVHRKGRARPGPTAPRPPPGAVEARPACTPSGSERRHHLGHGRGGGWLSSRIGAVMPAARSSRPSSTRATASQVGPALQGGPGHFHRAVPVAAGLDHRAQPGRGGDLGQHRGVVADGGQVDLRPGRPQRPPPGSAPPSDRRGDARGVRLIRTPSRADLGQPAGKSGRGRSDATRPSAGPSDAARPWQWAARAAASRAGRPRARKAPMAPDSTSPVPAVASRAEPGVDDQDPAVRGRPRRWGSLSSNTHRPSSGGHGADVGDAVVARGAADQAGVLALVGGQHQWRPGRPLATAAAASRSPRARSPSASTTAGTDGRRAAAGRPATPARRRRRPRAETGADHQGPHPVQPGAPPPRPSRVAGSRCATCSPGGRPPPGGAPGTPTRA